MDKYFNPTDFTKMNPDHSINRQKELEQKAKIQLENYVLKKLIEITLERPKNNEAHKKQIEECKEILELLPPCPIDNEELKGLLAKSYITYSALNP
tara:strand:- start:4721 stop:5008 length:288 start_codon:yes stop_codon:yes gene_type:complete